MTGEKLGTIGQVSEQSTELPQWKKSFLKKPSISTRKGVAWVRSRPNQVCLDVQGTLPQTIIHGTESRLILKPIVTFGKLFREERSRSNLVGHVYRATLLHMKTRLHWFSLRQRPSLSTSDSHSAQTRPGHWVRSLRSGRSPARPAQHSIRTRRGFPCHIQHIPCGSTRSIQKDRASPTRATCFSCPTTTASRSGRWRTRKPTGSNCTKSIGPRRRVREERSVGRLASWRGRWVWERTGQFNILEMGAELSFAWVTTVKASSNKVSPKYQDHVQRSWSSDG